MKEIKQEVRKYVTKYQAEDGRVFNTESQCLDYEARIKGTRRTCPNCNGKGYISDG